MMLKEQSFQERVKKFKNSLTFEMISVPRKVLPNRYEKFGIQ